MATQNLEGLKSFTAAGTIARNALCKLDSSGNIVAASIGDQNLLGFAQDDVTSGNSVTVAILTHGKVFRANAEGIIAAGNNHCFPTYAGSICSGSLSGVGGGVGYWGEGFTALTSTTAAGAVEVIKNFKIVG